MDYTDLIPKDDSEKQKDLPDITFMRPSLIKIEGRSYNVNPRPIFDKLIKEIHEFKDQTHSLEVIIDLDTFNTPSAKKLLEVFQCLEGMDAKIIWITEEDDEDMLEAGEDFESMIKLPFVFRTKPI
jgi:hypothetical protein